MSLFKKIDTFDIQPILHDIENIKDSIQWIESSHGKQAGLQYKFSENEWTSAVGKLKQNEQEYNLLNPVLENTAIGEIIKKYNMFRSRLMWINPVSCYSFHNDSSPRIHFPLITNPECLFVFRHGEMKYFPEGEVWWVDTKFKHTFLNTSKMPRLHLVGVVPNTNNLK
jgi:hypothetical protein